MTHALRLLTLAGVLTLVAQRTGAAESKFSFETVRARAQTLAAAPYAPPEGEVPAWLKQLTYDQLRLIEFDGRESLWFREKLPFMVQYLHPGFLFDRTVHLSDVHDGVARKIPFRREYFKYR